MAIYRTSLALGQIGKNGAVLKAKNFPQCFFKTALLFWGELEKQV
jgi:hypothetical protein